MEGSIRVREIQKFKLQFAVSPEFMTKYKRVKELMSTRTPGGIKFEEAFEALMDEYIEKHSPEARERRREARAAKKKMESEEKVKKTEPMAKEKITKREAAKQVGAAAKIVPKTAAKPALSPKTTAKAPAKTTAKTPAKGAKDPDQLSQGTSPSRAIPPSRYIPQAIKDQVSRSYGGQCAYTSSDGQRCGSRWNLHVDHIVPFALGGSNEPENLQLLCMRHNRHKAIKDFGKKKIDKHSKRK